MYYKAAQFVDEYYRTNYMEHDGCSPWRKCQSYWRAWEPASCDKHVIDLMLWWEDLREPS